MAVNQDAIRREIIQRDETDYLGPDAVNKKAPDAQVIDTTSLTIEEQIQMIVDDVRRD
ncbi:MAG: (d)CMP kinase [Candidatus Peribacteria bacterium]|nr:MAG: (d)CMP kinase [Candidatus Peribacteria bacterium]